MSLQFVIRSAQQTDAVQIESIQRQTWYATYTNAAAGISLADLTHDREGNDGQKIPLRVREWREFIASAGANQAVFVAEIAGKIVGFSSPRIELGRRRLGAIYVLPEFQSQGIGTELMKRALSVHAAKGPVYLSVMSYNEPAFKMYTKFGFVENRLDPVPPVPLANGKIMPEIEMVRIES